MRDPGLSDAASMLFAATRGGFSLMPALGSSAPPFAEIAAQRGTDLGKPLRHLIEILDRVLRRAQGIDEFSEHPHCLLRIARGLANRDVRLVDGCGIRRGAEVLDLHLWNERVSSLPSPRRGLARASALRRHLETSLRELAGRIATDPAFGAVAALRAQAAFVPRKRIRKVLRIARAFGFDTIASAPSGRYPGRLFTPWENLLMWALAWTFNPASLRRNGVLRERCELWISREALLARYVDPAAAPTPRTTAGNPSGSRCRDRPAS